MKCWAVPQYLHSGCKFPHVQYQQLFRLVHCSSIRANNDEIIYTIDEHSLKNIDGMSSHHYSIQYQMGEPKT